MIADIKEQIIKNSFWNIVSSLVNRVGGFILIVLLSRILMPEGFGKYSLAMSIALFFITFSDMGINQTLIRYISFGIDKNKKESASYFKYLLRIKFLITLFLSLILLVVAYPLSYYLFKNPSLFSSLLILSFYVFFTSLTGFFESLFFIKKYVRYISVKESFSLILKLIALVLIGFFISSEFKLVAIFLSFIIASLFSFLFVFYFSQKTYPSLFKKNNLLLDKKGIFNFMFFLNLQNISIMVLSQASIILLGIFVQKEFIGYYQAAWAIVIGIASLLFSSFSYTLLPIFTKINEAGFVSLLRRTFNMFFIFALPISFGLSALSKYFILVIYGYEYLPASISLSILSFLVIPIISIDLALTSFSAKNKLKQFSTMMIISMLFFLLLNFLFINFLSFSDQAVIVGVSIANLLSWSGCSFFSFYLLKKELKAPIISFWIIKPLLSCFIMTGFIFFITKILGDITLFSGIIIILSSALIYFISLFLFGGIKNEDFNLLKTLFKFKNKFPLDNSSLKQKNINVP